LFRPHAGFINEQHLTADDFIRAHTSRGDAPGKINKPFRLTHH